MNGGMENVASSSLAWLLSFFFIHNCVLHHVTIPDVIPNNYSGRSISITHEDCVVFGTLSLMFCQLTLTFSLSVASDYADVPCSQKTQCISLFPLCFTGHTSAFRVARMMMMLNECEVQAPAYTRPFSKPSDLHLALDSDSQESLYPF